MRWASCSGGGMLGWLQVATMRAVAQARGEFSGRMRDLLPYAGMAGISTGVFALFHDGTWEGVNRLVAYYQTRFRNRVPFRKRPLGEVQAALNSAPGVYNLDEVDALMREYLGAAQSSPLQLRVGATNLRTGEYRAVDQRNEHFYDFARASTRIPFFMDPVRIGGDPWADGGVIQQVPLRDVLRAGAEEVDVFLTKPLRHALHPDLHGGRDYGLAGLDHQIHKSYVRDLELCRARNHEPGYRRVKVTVFEPPQFYHNSLDPPGGVIENMEQIAEEIVANAWTIE